VDGNPSMEPVCRPDDYVSVRTCLSASSPRRQPVVRSCRRPTANGAVRCLSGRQTRCTRPDRTALDGRTSVQNRRSSHILTPDDSAGRGLLIRRFWVRVPGGYVGRPWSVLWPGPSRVLPRVGVRDIVLGDDLAGGQVPQAVVPPRRLAGGRAQGRIDAGRLHRVAGLHLRGPRAGAAGWSPR
jgi:hypothetical protein